MQRIFFFSLLNQYVIQRAGDENRNSAEGYNLDITPNSTYSYTRKCGTNGREKLDFVFWNNIGNESVEFSSFFHPFPAYFSFYCLLFDLLCLGPAGTGKTESVKALGHQLGRFVLVFNCDETFDFQVSDFVFKSEILSPNLALLDLISV